MTAAPTRLPALDGLRALSILLVLAAHLLPLGPKPWFFNETSGAMGMSLFFGLSGFLITNQLLHGQNVGRFLANRFARVLPLAWLYAFSVFVVVQFEPATMFWTDSFLINYLQQYLGPDNGHLWSLCVEMQFYLAIALIVLFGGRKSLWSVWIACASITALRIYDGAYINIMTHLRVDEILIGACLATVSQTPWHNRFLSHYAFVGAALALWFLSSWPLMGPLQYARPYATGFLFLSVLNQGNTKLYAVLASRPLRYIADISYALYVIHPITTHGWLAGASTFDKYAIKRPISFGLTFALAHLSTFYWERPWIRFVKSRYGAWKPEWSRGARVLGHCFRRAPRV
jgi:peptidoglycan/LPS O-acetylase OafA/YrhL